MRIGIDARPLISEKPSGIGMYVQEVLRGIAEDSENTYILYTNEPLQNKSPFLKRFEQRIIKAKIGTLMICFGLKNQLKVDKIDMFWGTEHMLPLNVGDIRKLLTVHDLALLIHPGWGSIKNSIMQNIFCRLSCKKADQIIAVSKATKTDLKRLLSIAEEKITVIYNGGGYNLPEYDNLKCDGIKRKLGLNNNLFFAYAGTIEPRKNIIRIIQGFEHFNDISTNKHYLVLAGKMGWKTKPILKAINNSRYREYIIMPGYIDEDEKIYLMKYSEAFLFPSNYEGFGIPVIESMSCGGIVITSNNSSLIEVGGRYAIYVKNNDKNGIAGAMLQCANMEPDERESRILNGKKWASNFTWERCSKETQALFKI